jgi:hypothetical protein
MSFQRTMDKAGEDKVSLLDSVEQGFPLNTPYERIRSHRAFQLIGELTAAEQTKLFIDFKLQFVEDLAFLTEDELGEIFPDDVIKRRRAQAIGDYIRKGSLFPPSINMSLILREISKPQSRNDTPQNNDAFSQISGGWALCFIFLWYLLMYLLMLALRGK